MSTCSTLQHFEHSKLEKSYKDIVSTSSSSNDETIDSLGNIETQSGVSMETLLAADTLDAQNLIDVVLHRNPSLTAMKETWRAALAQYPQVSSLDDPMLSYSLAPGTFGNNDISDGHRVELSQKLPWPGKLDLRGRIARFRAAASQHDIETVRQGLIQETLQAFYDYYYVIRAIQINEENIKLLREFQRLAEVKYAAGTASKQDSLQAEVERYHLEHQRN